MTIAASTQDLTTGYPLSPKTRQFLAQACLGHLIDGKFVLSLDGATMPVVDPNTGEEYARVAQGSPAEVDLAAGAARRAFEDGRWRDMHPNKKEAVLRRLAALLEENRDVLMDLDMLDGGIIRSQTPFFVQFGIDVTNYYAGWPTKIEGKMSPTVPSLVVQQVREPLGVCAVIMPWNGPSAVPLGVVAPLACGNSVILKPAEQTPLTAIFFGALCEQAGLPAGVLNIVHGLGGTVGAALVEHTEVDAISFIGSVATGRRIQAAAAKQLKRVSLELGGKSAQIVFADADLDAAATAAAWAVWGHSGQICTAGSRVLVNRAIHDEFVARMVDASRALKIGSCFDAATCIGPLISRQQLDQVTRYVELGKAEGANLALGGARHGDKGFFFEPTIFTGVSNRMTIAQEEIFGPVMAVIPFDTDEEAYAIANDTSFGLAAGVWTRDLGRAHRASQRLKVGTVWINTYQLNETSVPYGGVKQSGFGRSLGAVSIEEFTHIKSVWINAA